jgi:hypothetical protein
VLSKGRILSFAAVAGALVVAPSPLVASPPMRIWGTTLDNDAGISRSRLRLQVDALGSLPIRPVTRIVMDIGTTPADFAAAVPAIHKVSGIMAELGDSSEVRKVSLSSYAAFVRSLVAAYKRQVDIWEVGNEVNGEWVGTPAQEMARVQAAYDVVKAAGGKTALTLYYNPRCYSRKANAMFTWLANGHVPRALAAGLDYVTISYYPGDCNDYWPSPAEWQNVFDRLHARFPRAKLAFGESGFSDPIRSVADGVALLNRYVAVKIAGDNYVGGYFWWYWAEDAVPKSSPFWKAYAALQR